MNASLVLHNFAYACLTRNRGPLATMGKGDQWTILPDLCADSFVVSAGAGTDITFELDLVEKFGCTVVLLDPSAPGRITYRNLQPTPEKLHYLPFGLASSTGKRLLYPPEGDAEAQSWTISSTTKGEELDFLDLSSVMRRYERSSIDLLKMDIEGFEYEVLTRLLRSKILVYQICVEIHQGPLFQNRTRRDRWRLIFGMLSGGYSMVHHRCLDHTFVRR